MSTPMSWIEPAFEQVRAEVRANRLAHALLVQGDQGIGIEILAEAIAHFRLCQQPLEKACGQCKVCQLLRAGTHPDIQRLEPSGAGEVIKVDQIREAVSFLSQTPQIGEWKLVVISSAHRMNVNAANALLKVLEEPPGNSLLILVTDRPQLLIPTVRSRCRKLVLPAPSETETRDYCNKEGLAEDKFEALFPILGRRPLKISEWVNEGTYIRWKTLNEGVEQFLQNKTTTAELTDSLKEISLPELLEWLMRSAVLEAKESDLPSIRLKWSSLYDWLVSARQDAERGTNPNRQLLLDECFLRWKAAFDARMRLDR